MEAELIPAIKAAQALPQMLQRTEKWWRSKDTGVEEIEELWRIYIKWQLTQLLTLKEAPPRGNEPLLGSGDPWFYLKLFFFLIFIIFFFCCHSVPLYSPPSSNPQTVVHVHESIFLFAQSFHPLTSPLTSCHPALHLWVCTHVSC